MPETNHTHYDVIIIGAGSIGTPTAFFLARNGIKTLVIDRAASVGQESNKRAIGGIRATHSDPAKIRLCLRSIDIFSSWQETYGDDIEWYAGGYVFVVYREREEKILKELLLKQHSFGLNIHWLDKKQLLEVVPDLNSNDLLGGTYSPEDGSASPLLAIHAFYRHARRLGAEFHFQETIEKFTLKNGELIAVHTNCATYTADIIINAAGGHARQVGELAGLDLPVFPDSHRTGHPLSQSDDCGHTSFTGFFEFLFLPASHWSNRFLHHSFTQHLGNRYRRNQPVSTDGITPDD